MSFNLLNSEPSYNYVSDTNSWSFYNRFDLNQYQMCSGEVRYVLYKDLRNPEIVLTTKCKEITQLELKELESILIRKLWFFFNDETKHYQDIFDNVNRLACEYEKVKINKEV